MSYLEREAKYKTIRDERRYFPSNRNKNKTNLHGNNFLKKISEDKAFNLIFEMISDFKLFYKTYPEYQYGLTAEGLANKFNCDIKAVKSALTQLVIKGYLYKKNRPLHDGKRDYYPNHYSSDWKASSFIRVNRCFKVKNKYNEIIRKEFEDGTIQFFENCKIYKQIRSDGAVEILKSFSPGTFFIHNEDGPAIIYPDGTEDYYLMGTKYSKEEFLIKMALKLGLGSFI